MGTDKKLKRCLTICEWINEAQKDIHDLRKNLFNILDKLETDEQKEIYIKSMHKQIRENRQHIKELINQIGSSDLLKGFEEVRKVTKRYERISNVSLRYS